MTEKEKIKSVEKFIFNGEVQNILSEINDNVMDFNILEITGMGTQEVKHSNILGWLFNDSEHNLKYQILDDFLKRIIQKNKNIDMKKLQEYLYLPNKKREITVYREKDDIDLLIVDDSNKIVIAIENKVKARERTKGVDGGQLQKYEDFLNKKYCTNYDKYFIFLTINLENPSKNNWLKASYQIIIDIIEDILQKKEIAVKTKIILESYIDLLKRNSIVKNKKIEELCEKVWLNKDYAEALSILFKYKTSLAKYFYDNVLQKELDFYDGTSYLELDSIKKLYETIGEKWEEAEDEIFEVICQYSDDDNSISLSFSHDDLNQQNEEFIKKCNRIKNSKSKEIKRFHISELIGKGENDIVDDIKITIKEVNEKILSILNEDE